MHWLAFFSRMNYNIKEIAKLAKLIYKKAIKNYYFYYIVIIIRFLIVVIIIIIIIILYCI